MAVSANRLELLQIADAVAREKVIDREIVLAAMADAIQKAAPPQFTPAPPKVAVPEPKADPKSKKQPAPVPAPSVPKMPADPSLAALTLVCSTILASDAAVTSR